MNPRSPSDRSSRAPAGEALDPKLLAASRRDAMRRRASRIRRSVAGGAATLFVAAFLAIYVQLASGHDPALEKSSKAASASLVASGKSTSGESSSSAGQESRSSGSASSSESSNTSGESAGSERTNSESSSESATPVTTSQS